MAVIETQRLLLREMSMDDFPPLFAILSDPETMRFYPAPFDEDKVSGWIRWNLRSYRENGYGLYAMLLKPSEEVIGDCGFSKQKVDDRDEIEIGYHVRRDLWRRGFATEAARACVRYGFDSLSALRLISLIRPINLPSRRVAEKAGMTLQKEVVWRDLVHCVYAISREGTREPAPAETRHE